MKEIIEIKENMSDKELVDTMKNVRLIINNEFKERISEGDDLNELFEFYNAELTYLRRALPYMSVTDYLDDDVLCDLIDTASDWEFCEIHGLLDELVERAELINEWESAVAETFEPVVDKAIEILKKA